ncbi:MAG: superoxide dismutase [Candidatus Pacebacteria bacterium]|nr:superoxide dismutase [Candidatus Paceibacterota bacterium]
MFVLPNCRKSYSAYEPYIDEPTMKIHHLGHHKGYVEKLNRGLVDMEFSTERIEDIFEKISDFPTLVRNNAGGHYNHTVFWSTLNDSMSTPSTELMKLITAKYGIMEDFRAEFTKAALLLFGSGWVWLVVNSDGELDIVTTKNQDNPLMSDINSGYPLFGLDIWEHAYYMKHQNKRINYIKDFWSVLDWDTVSIRLSERPEMNDLA